MARFKKIIFLAACLQLSLLHACCSSDKRAIEVSGLRLLSDQIFESQFKFGEYLLGGLSGITYDKERDFFWAVSDSGGQSGPPRVYQLSYLLDSKKFELSPQKMIELKDFKGMPYKPFDVDYEGIVIQNNQLILSDEGRSRLFFTRNPHIATYSLDGIRQSDLPLPKHFIPSTNPPMGVRHNNGFESLVWSPFQDTLISANENSLVQDGTPPDPTTSSFVRWIFWKQQMGRLHPQQEYAYSIGPIPNAKAGDDASMGLVEIIALDKTHYLSLERTWNPSTKLQTIRIYLVTQDDETTDISNYKSLSNSPKFTPLSKKLLIDLDSILPSLKFKQKLDNIEGFTIGPKLKNGNHTLILISDNNFSETQFTQVITFEILP